jgi:peptidoglycan-associated lipoprotein
MTKKTFQQILPFVVVLMMVAMLLPGCAKKAKPVMEEPKPTIEVEPVPEPEPIPDTTGQALREWQLQMEADMKLVRVIYFDYDKSNLRKDAQDALSSNAKFIQKYPAWKVSIEGHCDERGTAEYNLALGERRAMSAYRYLVSLGIPDKRLSTVSYGEERPVDPGHTEAAWSKNRRAEFKIAY